MILFGWQLEGWDETMWVAVLRLGCDDAISVAVLRLGGD